MSDYSWSYSAYSTAVQCRRKFKYAFIDKLATEELSGDLLFGSALHSAINAQLTGQDGAQVFELYWMSYKDKEVQYGRHKWADLAKLGADLLRKFTKTYSPTLKLEFAEKRLYATYKNIKLEGTPDFYGEYNGAKTLLDFKTASSNYIPDKAHTALQLYLYAYLLKENNIGPIDNLAYFVFNKGTGSVQTPLVWSFNAKKMQAVLDEFVEYCSMVSDSSYPQNLNACLDYSRRCPYWTKCHKENE